MPKGRRRRREARRFGGRPPRAASARFLTRTTSSHLGVPSRPDITPRAGGRRDRRRHGASTRREVSGSTTHIRASDAAASSRKSAEMRNSSAADHWHGATPEIYVAAERRRGGAAACDEMRAPSPPMAQSNEMAAFERAAERPFARDDRAQRPMAQSRAPPGEAGDGGVRLRLTRIERVRGRGRPHDDLGGSTSGRPAALTLPFVAPQSRAPFAAALSSRPAAEGSRRTMIGSRASHGASPPPTCCSS